jgi:hypothetical protein
MCAYRVTLAVGNARRHDTGTRIRMDVLARSRSDAAVIAENNTGAVLGDNEYAYTKAVRVLGGHQPPVFAMAMAA